MQCRRRHLGAREWRPHVVVFAVGLPGLDGYVVADGKPAAADGRPGPLLLIAVSAYHLCDDREWAKLAGFQHHLTQPLAPLALTQLLATV